MVPLRRRGVDSSQSSIVHHSAAWVQQGQERAPWHVRGQDLDQCLESCRCVLGYRRPPGHWPGVWPELCNEPWRGHRADATLTRREGARMVREVLAGYILSLKDPKKREEFEKYLLMHFGDGPDTATGRVRVVLPGDSGARVRVVTPPESEATPRVRVVSPPQN